MPRPAQPRQPVGLPQPVELDRYKPRRPGRQGPGVWSGEAPDGRLTNPVGRRTARRGSRGRRRGTNGDGLFKGLVFDASGIKDSTQLRELWAFFHPTIRRVERSGRIVVLGTPPEDCESPREATAQRALEGFVRSVGKEVRRGATAQLVYVAQGAEDQLAATLRFLLSPRSAYVSAQVVRIGLGETAADIDWRQPQAGRVALVTGASRGIGKAIAQTLARDGAHVIGLDIPQLSEDLDAVAKEISGSTLTLDVTDEATPKAIADHLEAEHGGIDVVVHNAGVTRDKTLGRMDDERWDMLMEINLSSQERINDELLSRKLLRPSGRIVCVSSMSGIAGNAGQTNYATSKAGVIGMVQSMAPSLAGHKATINAVAPGFIETQMTAAMPVPTREAGRRMNSMSQGGLPVDVAETIAWFASPAAGGVNGNVVRVCGQSLLGA